MTRAEAAARLQELLAEVAELRTFIGYRHPRRKLTSEQARDIRLRVERGESWSSVARLHRVATATVQWIVEGVTYKEPEAQP